MWQEQAHDARHTDRGKTPRCGRVRTVWWGTTSAAKGSQICGIVFMCSMLRILPCSWFAARAFHSVEEFSFARDAVAEGRPFSDDLCSDRVADSPPFETLVGPHCLGGAVQCSRKWKIGVVRSAPVCMHSLHVLLLFVVSRVFSSFLLWLSCDFDMCAEGGHDISISFFPLTSSTEEPGENPRIILFRGDDESVCFLFRNLQFHNIIHRQRRLGALRSSPSESHPIHGVALQESKWYTNVSMIIAIIEHDHSSLSPGHTDGHLDST